MLKEYNLKTIFKPFHKIKQIIRPIKDRIHQITPGVYHKNCSCGQCYVGERGVQSQSQKTHCLHHTKNLDTYILAVVFYSTETKYAIDFENTKLLDSFRNYFERTIFKSKDLRKQTQF